MSTVLAVADSGTVVVACPRIETECITDIEVRARVDELLTVDQSVHYNPDVWREHREAGRWCPSGGAVVRAVSISAASRADVDRMAAKLGVAAVDDDRVYAYDDGSWIVTRGWRVVVWDWAPNLTLRVEHSEVRTVSKPRKPRARRSAGSRTAPIPPVYPDLA